MGVPGIKPNQPDRPDPEARLVAPKCPICGGKMDTVYSRAHASVCVCVDCHSGLSVPSTAYDIVRIKVEPES
jgi:hypothetical protein